MPKKLLALLILLVTIFSSFVAGIAVMNSPKIVATRAIENMVTDFFERDEIEPLMDTFSGGSIAFSGEGISEDGEPVIQNAEIEGKLYFSKDALMLSDFKFKYEDFKVAGEIYASKEEAYVKESEILKGAYGFKIKELADDLSDSIFAPDSDSEYALDEETFDQIIDALDSMEENKKLEKDANKLLKTLVKDFRKILVKNAEIKSKNEKVRLNGEKENIRVVSITINKKAMKNIIRDTYEYLCDSKDIVKFIKEYDDTIESIYPDLYDKDEYSSLASAYKGILKDMEDQVDEICDNLDDFETIEVKIGTPKLSANFLMLEIEVGDETILTVDCGKKGLKKTNRIAVDIEGTEFVYEIKENSRDAVEAVVSLKVDSDQKYEISFNIDKENESYTIEYKDIFKYRETTMVDRYIIAGEIYTKGKSTTVTVESITNKYGDEKTVITLDNCKLVITPKDKMPKPNSKYKTIADIKEKDIEAWMEKLSDLDFE